MSTTTLRPIRVGPTPLADATPGAWRRHDPAYAPRPASGRAADPSWSAPAGSTVVRPEGELRLTRRGRLAVFLACVALVLAAAFFLGASSVATEEPGAQVPTEVVTVSGGETLWELAAERTAPGGDVRDMMLRIERLNALESGALDAGQRLLVPAGGASGE